jgi:hypothetical protein
MRTATEKKVDDLPEYIGAVADVIGDWAKVVAEKKDIKLLTEAQAKEVLAMLEYT